VAVVVAGVLGREIAAQHGAEPVLDAHRRRPPGHREVVEPALRVAAAGWRARRRRRRLGGRRRLRRRDGRHGGRRLRCPRARVVGVAPVRRERVVLVRVAHGARLRDLVVVGDGLWRHEVREVRRGWRRGEGVQVRQVVVRRRRPPRRSTHLEALDDRVQQAVGDPSIREADHEVFGQGQDGLERPVVVAGRRCVGGRVRCVGAPVDVFRVRPRRTSGVQVEPQVGHGPSDGRLTRLDELGLRHLEEVGLGRSPRRPAGQLEEGVPPAWRRLPRLCCRLRGARGRWRMRTGPRRRGPGIRLAQVVERPSFLDGPAGVRMAHLHDAGFPEHHLLRHSRRRRRRAEHVGPRRQQQGLPDGRERRQRHVRLADAAGRPGRRRDGAILTASVPLCRELERERSLDPAPDGSVRDTIVPAF